MTKDLNSCLNSSLLKHIKALEIFSRKGIKGLRMWVDDIQHVCKIRADRVLDVESRSAKDRFCLAASRIELGLSILEKGKKDLDDLREDLLVSKHYDGPKYAGAPYDQERDEADIKAALARLDKKPEKRQNALEALRNIKQFVCTNCGGWVAGLEDGLHDTDPKEWKIFHDCGLCYRCWKQEEDPDATREAFQRKIDEFWDIVEDDLNETRSGGGWK